MSVPSPIRIEIACQSGRKYKTIESLVWDDIPALAVITGLNGSGKTQLLELLAFKLTGTLHPQLQMIDGIDVRVTGDKFGPESVAYLPSRWELTSSVQVGIPELRQAKDQLWSEFQHRGQRTPDFRRTARVARLAQTVPDAHDHETFKKRLPDDYAFMLEDSDVVAGLAHVLVAYRLRVAEELERKTPSEDIEKKLGPAPWIVINEAFQVADFPYSVVPPIGTPIAEMYKLELESKLTGDRIQPGDLSSGEKMLLVLVLWLYNSQHHGRFPKLMLLDEPDAHLHPSMTRQFLNVIKEVLVGRYGVRVILTTHSPSTVALAPEDSLFEMSRANPRITRSASSATTVGLLTSGLVVVSASSRFVLVEDESDVIFYQVVRDILSDYGPSRDSRAIEPAPSIVFLPASRGAGAAKIGGGSSVVTAWVNKFDQPPLSEVVRGVIDRDNQNQASGRIQVLSRYSIENYLLDPLVVYCLLSSAACAPAVAGVTVSTGDEHLIRELPERDLTLLLATVAGLVEPHLNGLAPEERSVQSVLFTNGKKVNYPLWILNRRGHDLLQAFQKAFGGPAVISPPRLEQSMRRLRLVPAELADIFEALQR